MSLLGPENDENASLLLTRPFLAFIEACLPTLRLDGSTKLPFMVHDLEDDDTGRFNPVKLDRRSNLEDLPLPAAKRLCPAPTENNDTDMDVDRAFSASMMQTNAPLSQASADIHPPLANAIVQLHELCKTHDLSRTQFHFDFTSKNDPRTDFVQCSIQFLDFFTTFSPAAAMADLLQVFRISLETEADYTQKSRKGGQ